MTFAELLAAAIAAAPDDATAETLQSILDSHSGASTDLESGDNSPPPHG